eukprot:TRINITY_DN33681_c0_g1_i1.p1 TRINITY_DN33681_c0_g1~~TRINITY_DN33681_c0_g1_i1.p1  ORF type:complete len:682 (+),score=80.45 TRINITY_DN33681_c0_g1_i1:88-2046(+)
MASYSSRPVTSIGNADANDSLGTLDCAARFHALSPEEAFAWLIEPVSVETFFAEYWEKKPLHIARNQPSRHAGLFTQEAITKQLRTKDGLQYGKEINVARCVKGKQVMHNGTGRAQPADIQRRVREGCSVQVVHPQRFAPALASLLARLESQFGCLWGGNSFRTPPESRGFKAHHDEVEVFMLQLEGAKNWRLHSCPRGPLPRNYCWEYDETSLGPPALEACVQAGDLLYLPRGTVHQGISVPGQFSHHVTVSTYQRTSWADFLGRALPSMLELAAAKDARYRSGLPLRFMNSLGEYHRPRSDGSSTGQDDQLHEVKSTSSNKRARQEENGELQARTDFMMQLDELLKDLPKYASEAADTVGETLAAQFVARRLPLPTKRTGSGPVVEGERRGPNPAEVQVLGESGSRMLEVRWTEPGIVRVVAEARPEEQPELQIYHSLCNSSANHMQESDPEPACLVLEDDEATSFALRMIGSRAPGWTLVADLAYPGEKFASGSDRNSTEAVAEHLVPWEIVSSLWDHGLVETRAVELCCKKESEVPQRGADEVLKPTTPHLAHLSATVLVPSVDLVEDSALAASSALTSCRSPRDVSHRTGRRGKGATGLLKCTSRQVFSRALHRRHVLRILKARTLRVSLADGRGVKARGSCRSDLS